MRRLIELTKHIDNPEFDRRHKYGMESVQTFHKGSRYVHEKNDTGEYLRSTSTDMKVRWDTLKLLLESSKEAHSNNALEAMYLSGVNGMWYEKRMCQLLWETNRDLFNTIVLRMIEEENNE